MNKADLVEDALTVATANIVLRRFAQGTTENQHLRMPDLSQASDCRIHVRNQRHDCALASVCSAQGLSNPRDAQEPMTTFVPCKRSQCYLCKPPIGATEPQEARLTIMEVI